MGSKINVKPGEVYGFLKVIRESEKIITPSGQSNRVFLCKCVCGTVKNIRLMHLRHAGVQSCGCKQKTINGISQSPIGRVYRAMMYRCTPNYFQSQYYHDKGVRVCKKWANSFTEFQRWAKANNYKPGLHIDRIDGQKGYSPDNCRFVKPEVNMNNRSNTFFVNYNGKESPIMDVLRAVGKTKHYTTILRRIKRGWDHQKAIDEEIKTKHKTKKKLLKQ